MRQTRSKTLAPLSLLVATAIYTGGLSARELIALRYASATGPEMLAGLEAASKLSPSNWRYPLGTARLEAAMGQHEAAVKHYQEAIRDFPACHECWLGYAESAAALGNDPRDPLTMAVTYGRSDTTVRTRAAVIYAKLDSKEDAAREFRAALGGKRAGLDEFYRLLNRIYEPGVVLAEIVTDRELGSYFAFARTVLPPEEVADVWERFRVLPESENQRAVYVAYLMQLGHAHHAWRVHFGDRAPPYGTVLNGDFESYDSFGALGWQVSSAEGVKAGIARCDDCIHGSRALRLRFDGEHNVHYAGTAQSVAVASGAEYSLKARVKYDEITSASGPALIVQGLGNGDGTTDSDCDLHASGEGFQGSSAWRSAELTFTVPLTCQGIRILLARPRTPRLNRFIEGVLWLDDVRLELISVPSQQASQDGVSSPRAFTS